jgi:protein-tyrosine kinase
MSKIEEALRKLQRTSPPAPGVPAQAPAGAPRPVAAVTIKKKVLIEGDKHHISQDDLLRGGLLAPSDQAGPVADEFRRIKRPLIDNALRNAAVPGEHMNVVMIASALPGAGKTFCTVNLALSMSRERELNVVLVDADVAKPHISREFGLADQPGLIDLLLDETIDVGSMLVRTDLNDIQVLPAGRRHPQATELLASERMSRLVHELSARYPDRIILLDSPPLLITSEAQALSSQVGQIALVVEAGRTSQQVLTQTIELLDRTKAINLILNKTRRWTASEYYGGDYPYEAYQGR